MNAPAQKIELSPMMARYVEFKARYPDALLFFQVGDFYELFYDDAVTVSRALNLTLTSRDKTQPNPTPMCGVPVSVLDSYLDRLVPLGHSVAVVSQTGSGQGVDRALERFVTPGMRLFTHVTSDSSESLIAAVAVSAMRGEASFAMTDPQTGKIRVREGIELGFLGRELANLMAREVVLPRVVGNERIDRRLGWVRAIEAGIGASAIRFRPEADGGQGTPADLEDTAAKAFFGLEPGARTAVRQLLSYLDEISLGNVVPVTDLAVARDTGVMGIDAATRRNLELIQNSRDGSIRGTLFEYLNFTVTAGGARTLRNWLLAPLTDLVAIKARLVAVRTVSACVGKIQEILKGISDLERLAARVQLRVASPKDLGAIRDAIGKIPLLREVIGAMSSEVLGQIAQQLVIPEGLIALLDRSLTDNPPHLLNDGGIIRDGFDPELDRYRVISADAEAWRATFESGEKQATAIGSLKVKSNNIIGYFIEVPTSQAGKVPQHYVRRQSTANAERYVTPELRKHEQEVESATSQLIRREIELFHTLRDTTRTYVAQLRTNADALARLDAIVSLGAAAERYNLIAPDIVDDPVTTIEGGKHPILAESLGGRFIPNSTIFDHEGPTCFIITGPNMGGKSTFLRQTALITVMAQMGSFVPAARATIGIADRVFARLGASDDLHEGDSTFMVEMREAAHILSLAGRCSLVLVDELGRGTATSDGLALAQAILEHLVTRTQCRTLFATHFHELTDIANTQPKVANLSVGSVEHNDQVIFTHHIEQGPAPRSYGLEVAKLSGLPDTVLVRAGEILATDPVSPSKTKRQLALFDSDTRKTPTVVFKPDPLGKELSQRIQKVDIDSTSPRQALEILYELRSLTRKIAENAQDS